MRIPMVVWAAVLGLALAGCGGDEEGEGGSGGIVGQGGSGGEGGSGAAGGSGGAGGAGGTGGSGGSEEPTVCETHCQILDDCGRAGPDFAECVDWCETTLAPLHEILPRCDECLAVTACGEWDFGACDLACTPGNHLLLESEGLGRYAGQIFYIQITDGAGIVLAADDWVLPQTDTDFSIPLTNFFSAGATLVVDWFVDVDASGTCTDVDASGHEVVEDASGTVRVLIDATGAPGSAGCGAFADLPVDIIIVSEGLTQWAGATYYLTVLDAAGEIVAFHTAEIGEAELDLRGTGFLTVGESYIVSYFVDHDADGACSEADFVATHHIEEVVGHTTVTFTPDDPPNAAACGTDFGWLPKDLVLRGTGFEAHEGAAVGATVEMFFSFFGIELWVPVAEEQAVVDTGAFEMRFPGVLEHGGVYRVSWLVDVDGDGLCDAAADVGGLVGDVTSPFPDVREVAVVGDQAGAVDCASFPGWAPGVTVRGSGFADRAGAYVEAYLVDLNAPDDFVEWGSTNVDDAGSFEIRIPAEPDPAGVYEILWFVSEDGFTCNMPEDIAGRVEIGGVDGRDVVEVTPPVTSDEAACIAIEEFWAP